MSGALIWVFAMLLSCCPLAIAMVVSPRYDALPKGRPASAAPLDGQNLARLVEHALIDVSSAAAAIKDTLGPQRLRHHVCGLSYQMARI